MNNLIIAIMGKSGSGKNYIANRLSKRGYSSVKSYTTRPIRPNDESDKDTHTFITPDRIEDYKDDIICSTMFNHNFYFATRKQLNENDIYILDVEGLKKLFRSEYKDKDIIVVYVDCNDDLLKERMLKRGDSEDAIKQRMENDKTVFADAISLCDFVVVNETQEQANDAVDFIEGLFKYYRAR